MRLSARNSSRNEEFIKRNKRKEKGCKFVRQMVIPQCFKDVNFILLLERLRNSPSLFSPCFSCSVRNPLGIFLLETVCL